MTSVERGVVTIRVKANMHVEEDGDLIVQVTDDVARDLYLRLRALYGSVDPLPMPYPLPCPYPCPQEPWKITFGDTTRTSDRVEMSTNPLDDTNRDSPGWSKRGL